MNLRRNPIEDGMVQELLGTVKSINVSYLKRYPIVTGTLVWTRVPIHV